MVIVSAMDPDEEVRRERFGVELTAALERASRTQEQLAEYMEVDQTSISAWKRGKKLGRMTRGRVEKLEQGLGPAACPPGSLVTVLFGPTPGVPLPADQVVERLDAIDRSLAELRDMLRGAERPPDVQGI